MDFFRKHIARKIVIVFLLFLNLFLQTSVAAWFSPHAIFPNFFVILTSLIGFLNGKKAGIFTGLISGVLIDLYSTTPFGFHILCLVYIGYCSGYLKRTFYHDDVVLPSLLVGACDFVYNLVMFVFFFLLQGNTGFNYYFVHTIFPDVLMTMLVTLLIYQFVHKVDQKITAYEKGKEVERD